MPLVRTGADLRKDLANLEVTIEPLIDEFLYKGMVMLLAANPGTGKSVLATQIAASLSCGASVFDLLPVPRPCRVYYIQLEGTYYETIERLRHMEPQIPFDEVNLCWDVCDYLNVERADHIAKLIERIQAFGSPDLIIIDPIYMTVRGGLSKDAPATAFVQFSHTLRQQFGCALLLIHHTHRERYATDGTKIEEADPFYGSQWLKAHVDVSYLVEVVDKAHTQIRLENKKARGGNVHKRLILHFRPETYTCYLERDAKEIDALTRVLAFIHECKKSGRSTDFYEVLGVSHLSMSHLRRLQRDTILSDHVEFSKSRGGKTIWLPK